MIAVCKSADLLLMVLDASKPHAHRRAREGLGGWALCWLHQPARRTSAFPLQPSRPALWPKADCCAALLL